MNVIFWVALVVCTISAGVLTIRLSSTKASLKDCLATNGKLNDLYCSAAKAANAHGMALGQQKKELDIEKGKTAALMNRVDMLVDQEQKARVRYKEANAAAETYRLQLQNLQESYDQLAKEKKAECEPAKQRIVRKRRS